jgi:hypothetical protein
MTLEQLQEHIWNDIGVRKHLAGRRVVDRIVADAVRDFPVAAMTRADHGEAQAFGTIYARSMARRQQQYGISIILTLVLSAIISEVVKALIRWWLASRENRAAMSTMLEQL